MLNHTTPNFFLGTAKPDEAKAFYADVIGLTFVRDDDYAVVFNCGAGELTFSKLKEVTPQFYTVLDFAVPSLETAHAELKAKGVAFERFGGMEFDAFDSWTTPDGAARIAWFKDPDGHMLSISERR